MPKQKLKVTPPRAGGVRTLAGCHDPPRPGGSRIEGVIIIYPFIIYLFSQCPLYACVDFFCLGNKIKDFFCLGKQIFFDFGNIFFVSASEK